MLTFSVGTCSLTVCNRALWWLWPQLGPRLSVSDVLDMVDVLVDGSEGLDEEIGFLLNEDMVLLTFPFSAVVPAALEARNKLLLGTEKEAGTSCSQDAMGASDQLSLCVVGSGILGARKLQRLQDCKSSDPSQPP